MADFEFVSDSVTQTIALGRKLGEQLKGGEVIALCGNLGAGKTHFIKGIAAGAGAEDADKVNSPTFVLVNEYFGRLEIYHIDAYRLNSVAEFEQLGFEDYCHPGSAVVIEWADKVESYLASADCIRVSIFHQGPNSRKISITDIPDYIDLTGD